MRSRSRTSAFHPRLLMRLVGVQDPREFVQPVLHVRLRLGTQQQPLALALLHADLKAALAATGVLNVGNLLSEINST